MKKRETSINNSPGSTPPPSLLFINRSYWPDVEATGQLLTELCEDLAGQFDVHVLCGQPVDNRDGESFQSRGTQVRNGVSIHRVRHTRFNKRSFLGRVCNYVTFLASATWTGITLPRSEVVVTETDPPLLCLLGRLLQLARRSKLVCYLQDIYPDVAVALEKLKPGIIPRLIRKTFFGIYRKADAVVVLSRDMRQLLSDDGIPDDRLHRIPNWMDSAAITPVPYDENRFRTGRSVSEPIHPIDHELAGGWGSDVALADKFVVMYSGNMGLTQRLDDVLAAAAALQDQLPHVQFVLVGNGASREPLEAAAATQQLRNVSFFDYVPKHLLSHSLCAADIHLVLLDPRITRFLMPSKLYGVLAAARPMIVLAPRGCELADVCEAEQIGWVVEPGDVEALVGRIRRQSRRRKGEKEERRKGAATPRQGVDGGVDGGVGVDVGGDGVGSGVAGDEVEASVAVESSWTELDEMGERGRRLLLREYDRPIAVGRFRDLLHSILRRGHKTSTATAEPKCDRTLTR